MFIRPQTPANRLTGLAIYLTTSMIASLFGSYAFALWILWVFAGVIVLGVLCAIGKVLPGSYCAWVLAVHGWPLVLRKALARRA